MVVDPKVSQEPSHHRRFSFPEAWLVLVALPAVPYGFTLGRVYSGDEEIPAFWWTAVLAAGALVLGLLGGVVFARVVDLAAIGSSGLVGFFGIALWLGLGADSPSDHDTAGLGLVLVVLFVVAFIPMVTGAWIGTVTRRGLRKLRTR
jgi:hypothetical protein